MSNCPATPRTLLVPAMVPCDPSTMAVATSVIASSHTGLRPFPARMVSDPVSSNFLIIFLRPFSDKGPYRNFFLLRNSRRASYNTASPVTHVSVTLEPVHWSSFIATEIICQSCLLPAFIAPITGAVIAQHLQFSFIPVFYAKSLYCKLQQLHNNLSGAFWN